MHTLDKRIQENRGDKIKISVVGVGATGSHLIYNLAAIYSVMNQIDGRLIHVSAFDYDDIELHNIGKQGFFGPDVGKNKAVALISRINRSYGLDWDCNPVKYEYSYDRVDFLITCVDSWEQRKLIWENIKPTRGHSPKYIYWMDIGNGKNDGQIILSHYKYKKKMPSIIEHAKGSEISENDEKISCSMIESLNNQGMFINKTMATMAADLIFKLIYIGKIDYRGVIVNMDKSIMMPIML